MTITPQQSRMARAALDMSVRTLAREARVTPIMVTRFEAGEVFAADRVIKLRAALEEAGIVFLAEDAAEGPGVRLAKGRERRVIVDEEGKHVADIVGHLVLDVTDDRRLATVEGDDLFALDGRPIGRLGTADTLRHSGSVPAPVLELLLDQAIHDPFAPLLLIPDAPLLLGVPQERSDRPA